MIKGIIFDLDGTLIQLPIDYEKIQKKLKEFFNISDNLTPLIPRIIELSKKIQQSVLDKFDIMINPEVNII